MTTTIKVTRDQARKILAEFSYISSIEKYNNRPAYLSLLVCEYGQEYWLNRIADDEQGVAYNPKGTEFTVIVKIVYEGFEFSRNVASLEEVLQSLKIDFDITKYL